MSFLAGCIDGQRNVKAWRFCVYTTQNLQRFEELSHAAA